jgi:hypothetical protein
VGSLLQIMEGIAFSCHLLLDKFCFLCYCMVSLVMGVMAGKRKIVFS